MFALGADAGVLVLGVVQQALQQRLDQAGLQGGRGRLLERPPQDALGHQPDVTGLVLKTLQGRGGRVSPTDNRHRAPARQTGLNVFPEVGKQEEEERGGCGDDTFGECVTFTHLDKLRDDALRHLAGAPGPELVPHEVPHGSDPAGGDGDLEDGGRARPQRREGGREGGGGGGGGGRGGEEEHQSSRESQAAEPR